MTTADPAVRNDVTATRRGTREGYPSATHYDRAAWGRWLTVIVLLAASGGGVELWTHGGTADAVVALVAITAVAALLVLWQARARIAALAAVDCMYLAAIAATRPAVPTVASVVALGCYLALDQSAIAFGVGTMLVLPIWLLAALFFRRVLCVEQANSSNYASLRASLLHLRSQADAVHAALSAQQMSTGAGEPDDRLVAWTEADLQLRFIDRQLQSHGHARAGLGDPGDEDQAQEAWDGLRWLSGTGYCDLWQRLHRAEESLIIALPREEVVAAAIEDEQRLEGCNIENRDSLLKNLRRGVYDIDPATALRYLDQPPIPSVPVTRDGTGNAASTGAAEQPTESAARTMLRGIRKAINEYRDSRYAGLIEARNRLYLTGMVTSLIAYLLVGLAIVSGTGERTIIAVTTFYLVGALVGLLHRLSAEAEAEGATDDYRLSTVRLFYAPLFSGLAAVGGVLLIALVPDLNPGGDAGMGQGPAVPTLSNIFHLQENQMGLVVAAVFGLTPTLLFTKLQAQTDRYKSDLKSIEVSRRVS